MVERKLVGLEETPLSNSQGSKNLYNENSTSFMSGTATFTYPRIDPSVVKMEGVIGNQTLDEADGGKVFNVTVDALTITLPATAVGLTYTFVNGGDDGAVAINISPNSSDGIAGGGLTAVDDKDLINTKATAKHGDMVRIFANGVAGWNIQEMTGTWEKE